jgi:hypothetical protein
MHGCTSTSIAVAAIITPKPTKVTTSKNYICSGESYTWAANGTAYTVGGIYLVSK